MIPSPKQLALIAMLCLTTFAAHAQLPILAEHEWEPVRDEVYLQEIEGRLPTKHPILAVAVFNGVLYAGSANGVEVLDGDKLVPAKGPEGTVSRLKVLNGALYAFTPTKLWRYDSKTWKSLADGNFTDGCVHLGSVVIASPQTLYRVDGDQLVAINEKTSPAPILGVSSYAETLYVRYENSVRFYHEGQFDEDLMKDWGHLPIGSKTRDMMPLGSRLMVPTTEGVATLSGMTWKTITGDNGLCYEDTTCIARGFEKQDFWVGTTRGAIRAVNGEYQYFGGQRWLPNDKVNAIASGDNVVYIATDGGLGIITYEPYTLEKKAAYYERWLDEWGMRRLGFVSTLTWDEKNQEWIRFISDNDGGWAGHLLNGASASQLACRLCPAERSWSRCRRACRPCTWRRDSSSHLRRSASKYR